MNETDQPTELAPGAQAADESTTAAAPPLPDGDQSLLLPEAPQLSSSRTRAAGEVAVPDSPMSIRLVKRLAEAVDGLRGPAPFFVTARFAPKAPESFDFDFKKFPTVERARADAAQRNLAAQAAADAPVFGVFGPFAPTAEIQRTHTIMNVVLKLKAPDGSTRDFDVAKELKEAMVTIEDGEPLPCDALFWSLSANEKFLEPYYTRAENLGAAAEVRAMFLQPDFVVSIHLPTTEIVNLTEKPTEPVPAGLVFTLKEGKVQETFIPQ